MSFPGPVEIITTVLRRYREYLDNLPEESSEIRLVKPSSFNLLSVDSMIDDDLRKSEWNIFRSIVREEGWRVFANGGVAALHDVADQVEEAFGDRDSWHISVLDKWFDGIGSDKSQWTA